ncbi:MAG: hypothetical protein R2784_11215 [Saprospiraceae bacterium]
MNYPVFLYLLSENCIIRNSRVPLTDLEEGASSFYAYGQVFLLKNTFQKNGVWALVCPII